VDREQEIGLGTGGAAFQNENCWYTPRGFRKGGNYGTFGIRKMKVCARH